MVIFLVLIAPFLVSLLTQGVKKYILPSLATFGQVHNGWIVLAVAVLSYAASILTASLSGGSFDGASSQVFVEAVLNFLGATGVFHGTTQGVRAVRGWAVAKGIIA